MNKKLTTILLAALLLLIGKVDAATLTQYVGDSYISQTVNEGQQVRLRFVDQTKFLSWTVESGNITVDTTNPVITFIMPNSDVVIRGNFAEEGIGGEQPSQGTTLSDVATVGAYVTYVPSSTWYVVPTTVSGYDSNQRYNPSTITSWRIFSNEDGNVEIISTDSVGKLWLRGETGYKNAVQILNEMSASYVNSEYAESGRSLGYYDETRYISETDSGSTMTETELANYKIINTYLSLNYYGPSGFPYTDYQYILDKNALANHGSMYHSSEYVWLGSRYQYISGEDTEYEEAEYSMRIMNTNGYLSDCSLSSGDSDSNSYIISGGYGVRPIISLKADLTVTGSGTEADPYIINESNPSQYTVTYCANGGYGEMNPQSVAQGSNLILATNTYEHHVKSFLGWSTSATATTATYTNGQSITPTADMTLYAVWQYELAVGDYVTYVPSSTSYTVPTTVSGYTGNQTFNPSSTTSWRVFSINGHDVEIISTDSVGDLWLYGAIGYINAVQTLNDMSQAFVNNTYATSGRSLGYSENGLSDVANYKVINTSTYPLEYNVSGFPYIDDQYSEDKTILDNYGSMYSSIRVWIASRNGNTDSESSGFYVRDMFSNVTNSPVYYMYTDGPYNCGILNGVRPVVSLKSDVRITGGTGIQADPYIINTSRQSEYVITYCANGGYGEMKPQSVTSGDSITLTTNAYKHHSKIFSGWSTNATTLTNVNGQTITPTADMTLYAIWETLPNTDGDEDGICDYCGCTMYDCVDCVDSLCEGCVTVYWCYDCGGALCDDCRISDTQTFCYDCAPN